jgi:hypothetical protein
MKLLKISIYEVSTLMRSKRFGKGQDVNRLNQICFSLAIVSKNEIDVGREQNLLFNVVAELG